MSSVISGITVAQENSRRWCVDRISADTANGNVEAPLRSVYSWRSRHSSSIRARRPNGPTQRVDFGTYHCLSRNSGNFYLRRRHRRESTRPANSSSDTDFFINWDYRCCCRRCRHQTMVTAVTMKTNITPNRPSVHLINSTIIKSRDQNPILIGGNNENVDFGAESFTLSGTTVLM
jgi:hypothetical protein